MNIDYVDEKGKQGKLENIKLIWFEMEKGDNIRKHYVYIDCNEKEKERILKAVKDKIKES